MFSKMNYFQLKMFRFISSASLIAVYILEMLTKDFLPDTLFSIVIIVLLLFYIISILAFSSGNKKNTKVLKDELVLQNEAKAAQFTYLIVNVAVFTGIIFTKLFDDNVVLSFNVLFCTMLAVSAVNDGYYLYLERKGATDAGVDNED